MTPCASRPAEIARMLATALALLLLLGACGQRESGQPSERPIDWPQGLVSPIQGTTFSMSAAHLPGSSLAGTEATSPGFAFFNGAVGRPLSSGDPVVAVAAGEILRLDSEYSEPGEAARRSFAALADQPGFIGAHARDELLGRQVWIRHENGHVSRYGHLSAVHPELSVGSQVEQGQILGLIGRSGLPPAGEDGNSAPARLHFEFWSPDAGHHLGEGQDVLAIHRTVARVFGPESLPRYARKAVEKARAGEMPESPYPPEETPQYDFSVDAPESLVAGAPFAIAITWEGDHFSPASFFPVLEGAPLGVIDAGNGAWILGATPPAAGGQDRELTVAAVSPLGTTLAGSVSIRIDEREATAPIEVNANALDQLAGEDRERESELFQRIAFHSMGSWEPEWSEPFQAPLEEGTVVASFAQKRYHGVTLPAHPLPGLRIRPDADPTVQASNSGQVVFAETLPVRGPTVVISHSGGVVSVYAGLASVDTEPGTLVERGQAIGQAGESLQWEIHAAGTPSDPLLWLDRMLPGR